MAGSGCAQVAARGPEEGAVPCLLVGALVIPLQRGTQVSVRAPFLVWIEVFGIVLPILFHALYGFVIMAQARYNVDLNPTKAISSTNAFASSTKAIFCAGVIFVKSTCPFAAGFASSLVP